MPANPLIDAGAIVLSGLLQGHLEDRLAWIGAITGESATERRALV